MTIEEFEETIEKFKREYLTIVKKLSVDNIWMAPHKKDWYHSQFLVIDIKLGSTSELLISLNVNTSPNIHDGELLNKLIELKQTIIKENYIFKNIHEAKEKFKELSEKYPFVLESRKNEKNEYVYSEDNSINVIEDKFAKLTPHLTPNTVQNNCSINIDENKEREKIFGNLYLDYVTKASFYNGLKSKGFVILAGISGIGKTKIFENFVENFGKEHYLFVPIRPDFRDTKSLLGYYNPLSDEYYTTPLLEFIKKASRDLSFPYFVLFDEMNLARIEYYFADFLSILESTRDSEGFTNQAIQLHNSSSDNLKRQKIPKELKLPPNLYFVGSVNIDDTTHVISPKVLDRVFTIEFSAKSFKYYADFLSEDRKHQISKRVFSTEFQKKLRRDFINDHIYCQTIKDEEFVKYARIFANDLNHINKLLPDNLKFGYRVFDEVINFILNSEVSIYQLDINQAFDLAIKMKVLPKIHGTRDKLETIFEHLVDFADSRNLFLTKEKIKMMQQSLLTSGYCSFI